MRTSMRVRLGLGLSLAAFATLAARDASATTVLELGDNLGREGAAAGDFGEVLGHLAEGVGGAVGKQEDGGGAGFGHGRVIPILLPYARCLTCAGGRYSDLKVTSPTRS